MYQRYNLAFSSVEHIMRDVSNGWLLRYIHANGASMFFIVVYIHTFRGLYYSSYLYPKEALWIVGCCNFIINDFDSFFRLCSTMGSDVFLGSLQSSLI